MKKLILLFLFISFHMISFNQVIKGIVLDKITNEKVCFATVYLDGTFLGTTTDLNGEFSLHIPTNSFMPLTTSAIGYYSTTLSEFSYTQPIIIRLKPKIYILREVHVSNKSLVKRRKANLKLFKNVFLGTTDNALNCEITNEKDISFNYESDRDTLRAFASKPILIYNKALGYRISYYLDKFEYYRKRQCFLFKGNIIFNEDLAKETTDKLIYMKRRETAYLGSRMHFFRSLWANNLKASGFVVKNTFDEKLNYGNIVVQKTCNLLNSFKTNKRLLQYPTKLQVNYYTSSSKLLFIKPQVYFDRTGRFDLGLDWEGDMATLRTGDKLPYEYKITR